MKKLILIAALALSGCEKMNETCRMCGGEMGPGEAMEMTVVGHPDFPGCEAVTMHYGGPGKLVDCLKCKNCGWSVTI